MKRLRVFLFFIFSGTVLPATGQDNADKFQVPAGLISEEIIVDGALEEAYWQTAAYAKDFVLVSPVDSVLASRQTEIAIGFDQDNFYIGGKVFTGGDEPVVQSLRRDFGFGSNDNVCIYIDPYNDYTNGFIFGITPYGVQRDGLVTNGQEVSTDWDNKWFSETIRYEDYWTFEMKIPFKSFRYNENLSAWNLIVLRNDLGSNERSSWTLTPQGLAPSSFAWSGKLNFTSKLPKPGANVALIPFITGSSINDGTLTTQDGDAGFDAKIGIGPSMNLDLTYNPDFSQVEVDRQVTNLDRFEIFFPERRQFFLENQDLFSEGGFGSSRPFFSRRIGISQDTLGRTRQIPIRFGARLSGKIGSDWRVGLLNMQTGSEDNAMLTGARREPGSYQLPGQNYTLAVVQKKVFARSNIGAIVVNRQATGFEDDNETLTTSRYNRVIGLDYNLLSADGRWEGDFFYHRSFDPDSDNDESFASGTFLRYADTNLRIGILTEAVGAGYNAEVGFVRRKDIVRAGTFSGYNFYPESEKIISHGPGLDLFYVFDTRFNKTDYDFTLSYDFDLLNTSSFGIFYNNTYEMLRRPFDPSGTGEGRLGAFEGFTWSRYGFYYNSDRRKLLNGGIDFSSGGFYNGERTVVEARVNYRYQPFGELSVRAEYNNLFFEDLGTVDFWLIGPEIDLTFSRNIFLTTFVQYNEQVDNINLNARLQWRYKPVSDLFIVYTENYLPRGFFPEQSLNRALVIKLTYWLNT